MAQEKHHLSCPWAPGTHHRVLTPQSQAVVFHLAPGSLHAVFRKGHQLIAVPRPIAGETSNDSSQRTSVQTARPPRPSVLQAGAMSPAVGTATCLPAWTSPQLRVLRQEPQFLGHQVPDLAVGEPRLSLHEHRVLVMHLEYVGHRDSELYFLRGEEAKETHECLRCPLSNIPVHSFTGSTGSTVCSSGDTK